MAAHDPQPSPTPTPTSPAAQAPEPQSPTPLSGTASRIPVTLPVTETTTVSRSEATIMATKSAAAAKQNATALAPLTGAEFIKLLFQCRLIPEPILNQWVRSIDYQALPAGENLASMFVANNWLTPFQTEQLLKRTPGGLVIDYFELRDFLGKGGMGSVFLAWDRQGQELVALKILPYKKSRSTRHLLRFQREVELLHRLQHPAIALARAAGQWRGVNYLAMEYIPGPTLYHAIRRLKVPLHPYWACYWLAGIANALDYAHEAGVIHRDLKPSNIIITPSGEAKLLDLGLARWYEDDHNEEKVIGAHRIVGSFDYMAPEQAENSARADARSDLYGLGCLLYFTLTGAPPFAHVETHQGKIEAHQNFQPVSIGNHRPDLPEPFVAFAHRLLAKDPHRRPTVAAQARDQLQQWAQYFAFQATETSDGDSAVPLTPPPLPFNPTASIPNTAVTPPFAQWFAKQNKANHSGFWGRCRKIFRKLVGR